jgi:hypothetical protein
MVKTCAAAVVRANTSASARYWSLSAPEWPCYRFEVALIPTLNTARVAAKASLDPHPTPDDLILEPHLADAIARDVAGNYINVSQDVHENLKSRPFNRPRKSRVTGHKIRKVDSQAPPLDQVCVSEIPDETERTSRMIFQETLK